MHRWWDTWDTSPALTQSAIDLKTAGLQVSSVRNVVFQARDKYLNPVTDVQLEIRLVSAVGDSSEIAIVVNNQSSCGMYGREKLSLQAPTTPGHFTILTNGVNNVNVLKVIAGAPSPANFEMIVTTVAKASAPHSFLIYVRDEYNNRHVEGGLDFDVVLKADNSKDTFTPVITDNANGSYTCEWHAPVTPCFVNVTLEPSLVTIGQIKVTPGDISPQHCVINCNNGDAVAGDPHTFNLIARDAFGNVVLPEDEEMSCPVVTLQHLPGTSGGEGEGEGDQVEEILEAMVEHSGNGVYSVTWFADQSTTEFAVYINSIPVGLGLVTIRVNPAPYSPLHSQIVITEKAVAGTDHQFKVIACDSYGNQYVYGGVDISVDIQGRSTDDPLNVTDNGDGTFTVSWKVNMVPGQHAIFLNGIPSDIFVDVSVGAVSYGNFTIEGGSQVSAIVATSHTFKLRARDICGNPVLESGSSKAPLVVKLRPEQSRIRGDMVIEAVVFDSGNGISKVTWRPPTLAGHFAVYVNNKRIASVLTVRPDLISPAHCLIEPLEGVGPPMAGEVHSFLLCVRDQYSNMHWEGDQKFGSIVLKSIDNTSFPIEASINDVSNGTYEVSWLPSGILTTYELYIDDVKVMAAAPAANNTTASILKVSAGPFAPSGSLLEVSNRPVRNEKHSMMLTARDLYGNPHSSGGLSVRVSFNPPVETVDVEDLGTGQYIIHWTPVHLKTYVVYVNDRAMNISSPDGNVLKVIESHEKMTKFEKVRDFYVKWSSHQREVQEADKAQLRDCILEDVEILSKIGEGAGGQLWNVRLKALPKFDKKLHGRKLALKKMWDYGHTNIKLKEEFDRDFTIPMNYPHRFILTVVAHFTAPTIEKSDVEREIGVGTTEYVLMELYTENLNQHISKQPSSISDKSALLILLQLSIAIEHLNSLKIAHRDLKTNNVMVHRASTGCIDVRLIDFGCATETLFTAEKAGNPANMAKEVLDAKEDEMVDQSKVDTWAMGCLAYELIKRPHPFTTKDGSIAIGKGVSHPPLGLDYPLLTAYTDFVLIPTLADRPTCKEVVDFIMRLVWPLPTDDDTARLDLLHSMVDKFIQVMQQDGRLELLELDNPDFLYYDSIEEELRIKFIVERLSKELL